MLTFLKNNLTEDLYKSKTEDLLLRYMEWGLFFPMTFFSVFVSLLFKNNPIFFIDLQCK